jgi:ABC-type lipoprotein export system ATPase subunit
VGHRFPGQELLFSGLTVNLDAGRVYALVGPSGSGKSTLLAILAGWITPTQGQVRRDDDARVGWVFQNPHGVACRSALDHVSLPFVARRFSRRAAQASAMALLDEFGLADAAERPYGSLSGGEAQRLMLARGIAAEPSLFLVDEPTAQLDTRTAAVVNHTLGALAGKDAIVVVATHDPVARDACTDVIDLADFA